MLQYLDTDLLRAFVAVAEAESFTRASKVLFRTQSAVSMQIKRLEDTVERRLFDRDGRQVRLTPDGELLIGYARNMLRLNDEALARFRAPETVGAVRIGTPDDYASLFLPRVLALFARTHQGVQIEVVCDISPNLKQAVADGALDLALISRSESDRGGQLVRREPLHWVGSEVHPAADEDPLPLAVYPAGCVCREHALAALDRAGRRWRLAYTSRSLTVLQEAVKGGFAVSALEESTIPEECRILDGRDGFPPLPDVEVVLHRARGKLPEAAERLADYIVDELA